MTAHLVKLCVGVSKITQLRQGQALYLARKRLPDEPLTPYHITRMFPRRIDEVLDGGSLYWTISGVISVRQRIIAAQKIICQDGISRCQLVFDPELIPVVPTPRRAFQGWRYLSTQDAPADLLGQNSGQVALTQELAVLGLL